MWSFPFIDPVVVTVFGWPIRWYGLMYLCGIWLGWFYVRAQTVFFPQILQKHIDDFLPYLVAGVLIGGRLGYVCFYDPLHFYAHPLSILKVWEGGMAFHGGVLGVAFAFVLYAWRHHLPLGSLADICLLGVPIGLFFGRLGNFINQEAYGRLTEMPWGVVYPAVDGFLRHPSQLYEATLEGIVLFAMLRFLTPALSGRPWALTGVFLLGYGAMRFWVELYRVPDALVSLGVITLTIGQVLSLPMIIVGAWLIWWRLKKS